MSNKDKREFEFIEQPGSPSKRPQGSRPSSRSIKMWVLFEGDEDAEKFVFKEDDFANMDEFSKADLDDFKKVLREHYPFLNSIENKLIALFDESLERLDPRTNLSSLDVGKDSDTTIIVRYPLSRLSINVNLKFVNNRKEECMIKHTTGSFNMLQVEAKSKFESLADCKLNDIYFEHQGKEIGNAYHFEHLVEKFKEEGKNELSLDLKVRIRNRKSFGDWKLEEVLKNIYNYKSSMLELVSDDFKLEDLHQLSPTLSDEELNTIVEQLKVKESV
ncbi:17587_t:CDS:2, partial [Funneliformis caledonium]